MIVGVPREIKADEYRVAMLPVGVEELTSAGHTVLIEAGAGQGSGIADAQYAAAGATIVATPARSGRGPTWSSRSRSRSRRSGRCSGRARSLFTYFHFAADEALTRAIIDSGITAIAYETLRDAAGQPAAADADERGRRPDEHPGGGQVPRAAPGGPGDPAGRRAGRRAGRGRDPRRRRRRLERRQGRRRAGGQRPDPGRQPRPPPLPRRHHAARTSPRSTPTGTRSASRSSGPTWSSAPS